MIIRPRVEHDGEDTVGLDAGTEGVESGFGEGDGDSSYTLIYRIPNKSPLLQINACSESGRLCCYVPPIPKTASESVTTIKSIRLDESALSARAVRSACFSRDSTWASSWARMPSWLGKLYSFIHCFSIGAGVRQV